MPNESLITHLCAAIILFTTGITGVYAAMTTTLYGRPKWTAAFWPVYGLVFAYLSYQDYRIRFLGVGLLVTVLGYNAAQSWSARVLGPRVHVGQIAAVVREDRVGFLGTVAVSLLIRTSPGALLLLMIPSDEPAYWLGLGIVLAALPAVGASVRMAFWPPKVLSELRDNPSS